VCFAFGLVLGLGLLFGLLLGLLLGRQHIEGVQEVLFFRDPGRDGVGPELLQVVVDPCKGCLEREGLDATGLEVGVFRWEVHGVGSPTERPHRMKTDMAVAVF